MGLAGDQTKPIPITLDKMKEETLQQNISEKIRRIHNEVYFIRKELEEIKKEFRNFTISICDSLINLAESRHAKKMVGVFKEVEFKDKDGK